MKKFLFLITMTLGVVAAIYLGETTAASIIGLATLLIGVEFYGLNFLVLTILSVLAAGNLTI